MHQHHYDIIVLGDSLASRLAAALLAKAGKKVLTFRLQNPPVTPWLFNSIHLTHVLEQLGGRTCLTTPRKLQVITGQSRLELHGKQLLSDELRREFPSSHNQVADLLQALDSLGNQIESNLLSSGGLPLLDLAGRLRFRRKFLLKRPPFRTLRKPLASLLDEVSDQIPRATLEALFSGLAMAPVDRLTIAEGALLWSSASQAQGISRSALDDLLLRRYEQFHGNCEPLAEIEEIGNDGRILLKDARTCSADVFIIGNSAAVKHLPAREGKLLRVQSPPRRWQTSIIHDEISPILASRVILAKPHPLRVTLMPTPAGIDCIAEYRGDPNSAPPSVDEVHLQLAGILPFTSFSVSPVPFENDDAEHSLPPNNTFPGTSQRLRVSKNLLLGSGADALPHLGSSGEIMTGLTLARHLLQAV